MLKKQFIRIIKKKIFCPRNMTQCQTFITICDQPTIQEKQLFMKKNPNLLSLFQFSASWCAPCQRIKPKIEKLSAVYPQVDFSYLDIDSLNDIAQQNNIISVPTFLLFKGERQIARFEDHQNLRSFAKTFLPCSHQSIYVLLKYFSPISDAKAAYQLPNYTRQSFLKSLWEAQFHGRTFLFFGKSWMNILCLTVFLYVTSIFAYFLLISLSYKQLCLYPDPPPKDRLDKYWLNSPKFRILSAYHNPKKRPAYKISCATYNTRYYYRGLDHPFGINEWKDNLYKLREDFLTHKFPGIQYPYIFKQFRQVKTPDPFLIHTHTIPLVSNTNH